MASAKHSAHFRLPAGTDAALAAIAAEDRRSKNSALALAAEDRITAWRAGEELSPAARPGSVTSAHPLASELWGALNELAAEQGTTATDEVIAAIKDKYAATREAAENLIAAVTRLGFTVIDERPQGPARPRSRPSLRQEEHAPATSERDCAHPKQRRDAKNPDLCRACGRPVT